MTGIILTPTCRQSQILYAKFIETDDNLMIVDWENIIPESNNDHSINVNFEGDSEDILKHPESPSGHTLSVTGTIHMDPAMVKAFADFNAACDQFNEAVRRNKEMIASEFKRIGALLVGISLGPRYTQVASLRRENEEKDHYSELERLSNQLRKKDPVFIIDEYPFLLKNKCLSWDHESHVNPYSKKISKIKVEGLGRNKGRVSAQYFSLKSTRKQNTSSVR